MLVALLKRVTVVQKKELESSLLDTTSVALFLENQEQAEKTKLTADIRRMIDEQMQKDDETTGLELKRILEKEGYVASVSSILRWRTEIGWTSKGTSYCQMIREVNKRKRMEWATKNVGLSFDNVIFSDESSIQIETHRQTHCYKRGQKPRYKPRPKHPVKVHVWGGISSRGKTTLCIFEGKMDATLFTSVLTSSLLPFTRSVYPDGHRFMQDNDPKHCSRMAREFYINEGINWWPTPPESLDMNPIENLWHELKEFIRREIKPRTKADLIDGIKRFWETVTVEKCRRYINHLDKVIPEIIECEGGPSGY